MLTDILKGNLASEASSYIEEKSKYEPTISQFLMIQQQMDLMLQLSKNYKDRRSSVLSADISEMTFDIPEGRLNNSINMSLSFIDAKKDLSVTQDQTGTLGKSLVEVKKCCSKRTYDFVRDYINSGQVWRLQKKLEKEKKYSNELSKMCLKLTEKVGSYELKIKSLQEKLQIFSMGKARMSQSQTIALSKEEQLIKLEKSIIYKEKLLVAERRKLSAKSQLLEEEKKSNENLRIHLQTLVDNMTKNTSLQNCPERSWEGQIFVKCKQNLRSQRKLLDNGEEYLEKHEQQFREINNLMKEIR